MKTATQLSMRALATVVITTSLAAQVREPAARPAAKEAAVIPVSFMLPSSEERSLESRVTGRTHRVYVGLPLDFGSSSTRYPVRYVLDGDLRCVLTAQTTRALAIERHIPPVIVVALGYGEDPSAMVQSRRRDYTPTAVANEPGSGGGPEFLRFLTEELVPFIDTAYRTDPKDRSLYGFSLGGLFAIYALVERGSTFHRFIAGSPSLWWDNQLLLQREDESNPKKPKLFAKVFLSVGAKESQNMLTLIRPFGAYLRVEQPNVSLTTTELAEETHNSGVSIGLIYGLRAIYNAGGQ